jgi:hypothetical protein
MSKNIAARIKNIPSFHACFLEITPGFCVISAHPPIAVEIMAKTNAMSAKNLIWLCQHIAILPTMILVSILER